MIKLFKHINLKYIMSTETDSKYQQWEHIKHIRELPDTYVGSSIKEEKDLYVFNNNKIEKKKYRMGSCYL